MMHTPSIIKPDLQILRRTIDGELPEYADGPGIETIIADIVRYGQTSAMAAIAPGTLPHDAIVQLFPGGDLPETGVDALTEADDILGPGSMVICIGGTTSNIPPGVDVSDDKLPGASAGKKAKVMDIFGDGVLKFIACRLTVDGGIPDDSPIEAFHHMPIMHASCGSYRITKHSEFMHL